MKNLVKKSYQSIHQSLGGSKLTAVEEQGAYGYWSKLKLMPKTKHKLPFSNGISVRGLSSVTKNCDVLTKALSTSFTTFDADFFTSTLSYHLNKEKKQRSGDYNIHISDEHKTKPVYTSILPWQSVSPDQMYAEYPRQVVENRNANARTEAERIGIEDIFSDVLIHTHVHQYRKLFESIKIYGVLVPGDLPKVYLLVSGTRWRWMMTGQGNHRFYILQALRHSYFNCEITQVVNLANVASWNNVINGIYSPQTAAALFQQVFEGDGPIRGIV